MDSATVGTVLGDFDDAMFESHGVTSTFSSRDGRYFVRTDGPTGALVEYEVAYTFGADPLQQYLIPFPDGRMQALGIAWDTRSESVGGQRWFHLYPGDSVVAGHPLHWTSREQVWNYQCAECHSTNLQKAYDATTDRYTTTWSEIDVACESCHGAGSTHVGWAGSNDRPDGLGMGLVAALRAADGGTWQFDAGASIARRTVVRANHAQIETCARCHARRGSISEEYASGESMLQTHQLSLLDAGRYEADGQILDEVYVYGSFVQSKMYDAGVTCSDCHDPHSLRLPEDPNVVCAQCHLPSVFDSPSHHFHDQPSGASDASTAVGCVDCHMASRTYMGVDPRRDHSFRIPRPDLTVAVGVPNACTSCHAERDYSWADRAVRVWYPNGAWTRSHYGHVLAAARVGNPGVVDSLLALVRDETQPGIVRATATTALVGYPSREALAALEIALADPDPVVRLGAVRAVDFVPPQERARILFPVLEDSILAVRILAARGLAPVPRDQLGVTGVERFDRVIAEYVEAQLVNAERAEAYLNLGALYVEMGDTDQAEQAFVTAIARDSSVVEAFANLADLYRSLGREAEGESVLRRGLAIDPNSPALVHALGLLLVRQSQTDSALVLLERAAALGPEISRYGYVHAIALHSVGRSDEALGALDSVVSEHPYDRDVLLALATTNLELGRTEEAMRRIERFAALYPDDPRALEVMRAIRSAENR